MSENIAETKNDNGENSEPVYKIKTKNYDGKISEIDVSFDIAEYNKNFRGKEKYYKRKTKKYSSFDELMQQNENCEENRLPKLPIQLATPSLESEAISNIEGEFLRNAIDKLSWKQRQRILLHFFGGLTFSEIAKLENRSKSSISESIYLALRILKGILKK